MTLVSPTDLADYLGETVDNQARAYLFCDLADDVIAQVVGGVIPTPAPPVFRAVALALIARVYTNPRGVISENIGNYSYNLNRNLGEGGLALTVEERRLLRRAVGVPATRSVTLVPTVLNPSRVDGYYGPR